MLDLTTGYSSGENEEAAAHAAMVETPSVAAAAGMFAPFAAMQEASVFWRRSVGLARRWNASLAECRSPAEMIEVNARFGEKALSMGYSEWWRVMERSALLGRRAVAPGSFALRDVDPE